MTPAHWSAHLQQLEALDQQLEAALQAARDSLTSGEADTFAQRCAALGQTLQNALPQLAQATQSDGVPTEFRLRLQALQKKLELLQRTQARLAASNQQALGVLFPADQIQAYSRLGRRGPSLGSASYLKA